MAQKMHFHHLTATWRSVRTLEPCLNRPTEGGGFLLGHIMDSACPGQVLGVMAWCAPQCSKPHLLAHDDARNVLLPFRCYLTVRERAIAALKSASRGGGFLLGHIMDSACPGPVFGWRNGVVRSVVVQTAPISPSPETCTFTYWLLLGGACARYSRDFTGL
jgi:hypothetical protein